LAEGPEKCRIVIAALDAGGALPTALIDLGQIRIEPEAICLAGTTDALAAAQHALAGMGPPSAPYLPLLHNLEPIVMPAPDLPLLATSDRLLTKLKGGAGAVHRDRLQGRCWLADPMRSGLVDRMGRGDVMLIAGPLSAEHMKLGTRVLLQHSRFPVQSHEFLAPPLK
jgi:hypothetical protein